MTVTAPPRPPRPNDPVDREEIEALVEALIEEARKRAQRRRRRNGAVVTLAALVGVALFAVLGRSAQSQTASPAVSARLNSAVQAVPSTIAFATASLRPAQPPGGELYVVNADGSEKRLVVRLSFEVNYTYGALAWSPDGQKIAFADGSGDVYVVNADGSGLRRLTRNGASLFPIWSPNGRKIAFMRVVETSPEAPLRREARGLGHERRRRRPAAARARGTQGCALQRLVSRRSADRVRRRC